MRQMLLLVIVLILGSCRSSSTEVTPPVIFAGELSLQDMRHSVIAGLNELGWKVVAASDKEVIAELTDGGRTWGAQISVPFTENSFNFVHRSSFGLGYSETTKSIHHQFASWKNHALKKIGNYMSSPTLARQYVELQSLGNINTSTEDFPFIQRPNKTRDLSTWDRLTLPTYKVQEHDRAKKNEEYIEFGKSMGLEGKELADFLVDMRNSEKPSSSRSYAGTGGSVPTLPNKSSAGTTGFFKGERRSGHNKVCFYDVVGSVHTLNVGSAEICPLSAEF